MLRYALKRMFFAGITVFAITALTFFMMHLIPGDPFMSEKTTEATRLFLREKYGLDQPIVVQFQKYVVGIVKGDLGVSYVLQKNRPIAEILWSSFRVSARVGLYALAAAMFTGILLGCIAGYYKNSWVDKCVSFLASCGISVPGYVVASCLMMYFGVKWKVLPVTGLDTAKGYILPVITLALQPTCNLIRLTRGSIVDVLEQDYLRTVRAKGMSQATTIFVHALKNSLIPIVTYLGPLAASILTGGFVVENMFHIPGLGRYFVSAISCRDYTLIMAITIFYGALMIGINFICDLLYGVIDPRVRLEG
ncbi:MAG: ABC transporter permease [Ruminococcus sp.]|nr:ABC transporter permease [Ruminococcus sp.]